MLKTKYGLLKLRFTMACVHHMHVIELCGMKFQIVTLICSLTLRDPDVSMPFKSCSPLSEKIHDVHDVVALGVLV